MGQVCTDAAAKLREIFRIFIGDSVDEWEKQKCQTKFNTTTDWDWANHLLSVHRQYCTEEGGCNMSHYNDADSTPDTNLLWSNHVSRAPFEGSNIYSSTYSKQDNTVLNRETPPLKNTQTSIFPRFAFSRQGFQSRRRGKLFKSLKSSMIHGQTYISRTTAETVPSLSSDSTAQPMHTIGRNNDRISETAESDSDVIIIKEEPGYEGDIVPAADPSTLASVETTIESETGNDRSNFETFHDDDDNPMTSQASVSYTSEYMRISDMGAINAVKDEGIQHKSLDTFANMQKKSKRRGEIIERPYVASSVPIYKEKRGCLTGQRAKVKATNDLGVTSDLYEVKPTVDDPLNTMRNSLISRSTGGDGCERTYGDDVDQIFSEYLNESYNATRQPYAGTTESLYTNYQMCDGWVGDESEVCEYRPAPPNARELVSCDLCGKFLGSRSNLSKHRRIHTGHRPHVCEICSKGFTDRSNFVKHMRRHRSLTASQTFVTD